MPSLAARSAAALATVCSWLWMADVGSAQSDVAQPRPSHKALRQDEDWRGLPQATDEQRPLDALKHVRLGPDWSLAVGGQARLAYELFVREAYGTIPQDDSGSWLVRLMPHAALYAGPHVRWFAELKSTHEAGRDGGPTPMDVDRLDIHQGFVEVGARGTGDTPGPNFRLRVGRQELRYGAGRLVDVRDGPTVRRSFDAVLARTTVGVWTQDTFFANEVEVAAGVFDDGPVPGARLWGTYGTTAQPILGGHQFDLYYLGASRDGLGYEAAQGSEMRHSTGARAVFNAPRFGYDVEGLYQFGRLSPGSGASRRIKAWGVGASARLTLVPRARWSLLLDGGYSSGDRTSTTSLETFRAPFPNLRYAGATTLIGPGNTFGLNPAMAVSPHRRLTLSAQGRALWRSSVADGVYHPAGFPLRTSNGSQARFIGSGATLALFVTLDMYSSLYAVVEYFRPGAFLKDVGPARTPLFLTVGFNSRF